MNNDTLIILFQQENERGVDEDTKESKSISNVEESGNTIVQQDQSQTQSVQDDCPDRDRIHHRNEDRFEIGKTVVDDDLKSVNHISRGRVTERVDSVNTTAETITREESQRNCDRPG